MNGRTHNATEGNTCTDDVGLMQQDEDVTKVNVCMKDDVEVTQKGRIEIYY